MRQSVLHTPTMDETSLHVSARVKHAPTCDGQMKAGLAVSYSNGAQELDGVVHARVQLPKMDTFKIKSKNFKNGIDLRLGMAREGGERASKETTLGALVCIS